MRPTFCLGILDWGIGGIGVAKLVESELGAVTLVYLSDTGVTPYGKMSRRELVSRIQTVIAFLQSQGATHVAIGCNAASTALPFLKTRGVKVEGIIDSAVRAAARLRPARLAVIGGRRTVLSGIYRCAFAERGITVEQRIGQPLSALIESGDVSSRDLREECRRILSPVQSCSHLLLACTHYPAIIPVLKQFVSADTVIIDPAAEMLSRIKRWSPPIGGGPQRFFTTGDAKKMKSAAWNAFGFNINTVRKISI